MRHPRASGYRRDSDYDATQSVLSKHSTSRVGVIRFPFGARKSGGRASSSVRSVSTGRGSSKMDMVESSCWAREEKEEEEGADYADDMETEESSVVSPRIAGVLRGAAAVVAGTRRLPAVAPSRAVRQRLSSPENGWRQDGRVGTFCAGEPRDDDDDYDCSLLADSLFRATTDGAFTRPDSGSAMVTSSMLSPSTASSKLDRLHRLAGAGAVAAGSEASVTVAGAVAAPTVSEEQFGSELDSRGRVVTTSAQRRATVYTTGNRRVKSRRSARVVYPALQEEVADVEPLPSELATPSSDVDGGLLVEWDTGRLDDARRGVLLPASLGTPVGGDGEDLFDVLSRGSGGGRRLRNERRRRADSGAESTSAVVYDSAEEITRRRDLFLLDETSPPANGASTSSLSDAS